jgi:hypothetical protein
LASSSARSLAEPQRQFPRVEFVVRKGPAGERTLVFRDARHEYTFTEK